MYPFRGIMGPQDRLAQAIESIGAAKRMMSENQPCDQPKRTVSVSIPRGTLIPHMAWQFDNGAEKKLIHCNRDELYAVCLDLIAAIQERDYGNESTQPNK